ncbi:MAG: NosD domain-containing protein, partial [Burkholderiaceae bacterium]|nr:NosD domain-containing protein [Burkholderiaceae bacterium]
MENVVINKNVTLMAASDVGVNALNSALPVFTVNSNGSGSTIQGLVITGATSSYGVYLNQALNCNIIGNTLTNNNNSIVLGNSKDNNIMHNIMNDNGWMGISLWYSNNTAILGNTITNNRYGIWSGYSNNTTVTENTITGSVYGINPQYSTMDIHFNRISGSSSFGIVNQANSTINATNNWWGTSTPSYLNSPTWPSYRDIWNANGTLYYSPYFTSDIGFTSDQIINASLYVKNYIESNHQLPSSVNISGIMVNMPQFLKLATTAVLNINNGMNTTIVLGSVGNASSPKESISVGIMMDTDYINMANNIINFIDNNGTAPSYVNDTYLDTSIRYESVVYIYSQILNTYNTTIGLPDYIPLIPWISVSNPNGIYNFRTQKVFSSIQAAIDENDTLNEDTIWLGKGPIIENVIVNKSLTITPIYENENVIVQALNLNLPVFTIEINGTGSIIRNLIINGSTNNAGIYIKSSNNTISGNNITGNLNGIYINNF